MQLGEMQRAVGVFDVAEDAAGADRVVMDVLGHSQLSITMDLYSHVMPSALRDAADAMDRALRGRSMIGSP